MGSASTERGEASRERILAAAFELFADRGYAATSVAEVCEAAHVARTALYWHFDSKDGLLAAVLERSARAQVEQIQKAVSLAGDPLARLDEFMRHLRRVVEEQCGMLRLHLSVALERGHRDAATGAALRRVSRAVRKTIVDGLEDAVGQPVPDADLIAHTVLSLLDGTVLAMLIDPDLADLDRLDENVRTTFVLLTQHRLEQGGISLADIIGDTP